jgi:hypothetical protein
MIGDNTTFGSTRIHHSDWPSMTADNVRHALQNGEAHVFESEMKQRRRSHGRP